MSQANPLWGAPRIHGELLKLGIRIGQTAVAKYMARRPRAPSPSWRTFLKQHVEAIAAIDMFIVVSATFQMLYVVIVLRHDRRRIAHFGVTRHPTQAWLAHQVTEAFPWDTTPRYLLRDRDTAYGHRFRERVRVMGLEQVVTAPRSPWQNAYVERVIGSIRRDCLDYPLDRWARLGNVDPGNRRQRDGGVNASLFDPGQVLRPSSTSVTPADSGPFSHGTGKD
jgi:transposase InsO family protein